MIVELRHPNGMTKKVKVSQEYPVAVTMGKERIRILWHAHDLIVRSEFMRPIKYGLDPVYEQSESEIQVRLEYDPNMPFSPNEGADISDLPPDEYDEEIPEEPKLNVEEFLTV